MEKIRFSNSFFFLAVFLVFSLGFSSCQNNPKPNEEYLIVLSLDGFRWDYVDKTPTPNIDRIAKNGVKAERLISSWPTTTFANHYSIATGLYPHHHGIVANRFYCPELKESYNSGNNRYSVMEGKFYGGEPIWVSAEKQDLKSATCFWVGSEADVDSVRPAYWKKYDHYMPYSDRIDTVLHWVSLPEDMRPRLLMWYLDEPDSSGHTYGPENDSLSLLIGYLDSLIGVFLNGLEQLPYFDQINFILVSDHGMMQLSDDSIVYFDQYLDKNLFEYIDGWNPTMNLKVKDGKMNEVIEKLEQMPHISFWKNGEAPEHIPTGFHPRFHDITVLADDYWRIEWSNKNVSLQGAHGYQNANTDMHGIFYAMGPAFKKDYTRKAFQNIHLYSLMAEILQIQPAKTDGSLDSISDVLDENRK